MSRCRSRQLATVIPLARPESQWDEAVSAIRWALEDVTALSVAGVRRRSAPTREAILANAEWSVNNAVEVVTRELGKFDAEFYDSGQEQFANRAWLSAELGRLLSWQRQLRIEMSPPAPVYVLADYRKAGAS